MNIDNLTLYVGDSWDWTETILEYPASDGHTLVCRLRYRDNDATSITASASGDAYAFSLSYSQSAAYSAGVYAYQYVITTTAGKRYTVAEGVVPIAQNLTSTTADARTYAQQRYDDLKSRIEQLSATAFTEVSDDGTVIKYDRAQLYEELKFWKREKDISNGKKTTQTVSIQFEG